MLICSANVFLNLSGGVGGEILRRHGDSMQHALHAWLSERRIRHVNQGDVVRTDGCGTGFRHVLHAVAVDGWYQCSAEAVRRTLENAFVQAATIGAKNVAVVALGTGYGRLRMKDFGTGLRAAVSLEYPPMEAAVVVVNRQEDVGEINDVLKDNSISAVEYR